jgi:hypothetical protein
MKKRELYVPKNQFTERTVFLVCSYWASKIINVTSDNLGTYVTINGSRREVKSFLFDLELQKRMNEEHAPYARVSLDTYADNKKLHRVLWANGGTNSFTVVGDEAKIDRFMKSHGYT